MTDAISRLADGREGVISRIAGPMQSQYTTPRNIPVEPDEVWEIADTYDRLQALRAGRAMRSRDVQMALDAEMRRLTERLNAFLDRVGITEKSLEDVARDTPPSIEAVILNVMTETENEALAKTASNPNPIVVSMKGRGLGQEAARSARIELSLPSGVTRSIPLRESRVDVSTKYIEWVAPRPVSSYGAVPGSWCSVLLDVTLYSGANLTRCVTRFALD